MIGLVDEAIDSEPDLGVVVLGKTVWGDTLSLNSDLGTGDV